LRLCGKDDLLIWLLTNIVGQNNNDNFAQPIFTI